MLDHPVQLILVGFVLVMLGMILPFLEIIQVIPSTLFLNFFAYTASVLGLFLGIMGSAFYIKSRKRPKQ
jgi:hypothetical protein